MGEINISGRSKINRILCSFVLPAALELPFFCAGETPPNIIAVVADDLGYADLGFQGSPDVLSPNLDQLARGGIVFSNGYVCHPVCGPSRAGFLTGRYPHRVGFQVNVPFSPCHDEFGLPLGERMFAQDLQDAGYRTGIIGKWHQGTAPQYHPNERGFDYFFGFLGGGHQYWPETYAAKRPWQFENLPNLLSGKGPKPNPEGLSYVVPLLRNREYVKERGYLTDVFTREAIDYIGRNKKHPFFLYLAYNAPHKPLQAKPEDLEKVSHIKGEKRRTYAAMIYAVDRGVGEIRRKLEKEGLLDNTLIVFFSDNGGITENPPLAINAPLSGEKGQALEGGYHVPFFIHWPAVVHPVRSDEIVSTLDLCPTFLEMAGQSVTDTRQLDGYSLLPFLRGESEKSPRTRVFCRRDLEKHMTGAREGRWKYYENAFSGQQSLYDLSTDIGEHHDVAKQFPEQFGHMQDILKQWQSENRAPMWPEPGWFWRNNPKEAFRAISAFREELVRFGDCLPEENDVSVEK